MARPGMLTSRRVVPRASESASAVGRCRGQRVDSCVQHWHELPFEPGRMLKPRSFRGEGWGCGPFCELYSDDLGGRLLTACVCIASRHDDSFLEIKV